MSHLAVQTCRPSMHIYIKKSVHTHYIRKQKSCGWEMSLFHLILKWKGMKFPAVAVLDGYRGWAGCLYLCLVHSYKGPILPPGCFLWGDKNLFQNVPSCGLRFPCWGLADEAGPRSPEEGTLPWSYLPCSTRHPVSQCHWELCTRKKKCLQLVRGGHTATQAAQGGGSDSKPLGNLP